MVNDDMNTGVIGIFVDFLEAFHTINHNILFHE